MEKQIQNLSEDLAEQQAINALLLEELRRMKEEKNTSNNNVPSESEGQHEDISSDFNENVGPSSTRCITNRPEESRFMASMTQLSVSSVNVPECKPSEDDDEIHRHTYESWKDLLLDTMKLAGIEDEATRFIIFKVKAGQRLLDIFKNTKSNADAPDSVSKPFSNALYRLQSYFGSG